jgi:hypothetical protein
MSVRSRPWYVLDGLCNDYSDISSGDLRMLQALKVLRGITLNLTIAALCIIMVLEGGDPTVIGSIGLIGLMVINGVELTDYLAAKQALDEAQQEATTDE